MKLLSIGKKIEDDVLVIHSIDFSELETIEAINSYDYIIITGGDGALRRCVKKILEKCTSIPPLILNAQGSFNVISKIHRVNKLETIFNHIKNSQILQIKSQDVYSLNHEIFLFSAGNMGDLQHIFLSETLRFGILKKGFSKYFLAGIFLLPVHIIMSPFMLLSSKRFFIFTPFSAITKVGSFYGKVNKITIDLDNHYNLLELDGDIVTIENNILNIEKKTTIDIIVK